MKWDAPMDGEIRVREVFAWWPIPCRDGTKRWLERVTITERFHKMFASSSYWEPISAGPVRP